MTKSKGVITVRQVRTGRALYNDPVVGWRWAARRLATPMDSQQAAEMVKRVGGVICIDGVPEGVTVKPRPKMPNGKAEGEWDKLGTLRKRMAAEDWQKALRLAKTYSKLGADKAVIERAWEAYTRPSFCRSLGRDPEELKAAGIEALRRRFGETES